LLGLISGNGSPDSSARQGLFQTCEFFNILN
jgi:hypothetical protein